MSKAMDALDRLADTIGGCTCSMCTQNREDTATIRDYITTTEAERAARGSCGVVPCPECGGDGADHEDSWKNCWNCNGVGVVRDTRNTIPASDESAARIKELEEALKALLDTHDEDIGMDEFEDEEGVRRLDEI